MIRGAAAGALALLCYQEGGSHMCGVSRRLLPPAPPPTSFRYQSAALKQARYLVWRTASSVVSRGRGLRGRFSTHYTEGDRQHGEFLCLDLLTRD